MQPSALLLASRALKDWALGTGVGGQGLRRFPAGATRDPTSFAQLEGPSELCQLGQPLLLGTGVGHPRCLLPGRGGVWEEPEVDCVRQELG